MSSSLKKFFGAFKTAQVPHWNRLLRTRELAVSRFSGIVLLVVPTMGALKTIAEETVGFSVEIPINFVLLYFSALLVFLANIVFDLSCPSVIKINRSYQEFFKGSQLTGLEILSKIIEVQSSSDAALDKLIASIGGTDETLKAANYSLYADQLVKLKLIHNTGDVWDAENKSSPRVRTAILLMYSVGSLVGLILVPIGAARVVGAL